MRLPRFLGTSCLNCESDRYAMYGICRHLLKLEVINFVPNEQSLNLFTCLFLVRIQKSANEFVN